MSSRDQSWVNMGKQHLVKNYPQMQRNGNKQALIFNSQRKGWADVWADWKGYLWVYTPSLPPSPKWCCAVPARKKKLSRSVIMWGLGLWGGHKQSQTDTFLHNVGKSLGGKNPTETMLWKRFHFFFWSIFLDIDTVGTKSSPVSSWQSRNNPPIISNRSPEPDLKRNLRSFMVVNTASVVVQQHDCSRSLPVQRLSIGWGFSPALPWGVLLFYKWALMQEKVTWIQTDGGRDGGREGGREGGEGIAPTV